MMAAPTRSKRYFGQKITHKIVKERFVNPITGRLNTKRVKKPIFSPQHGPTPNTSSNPSTPTQSQDISPSEVLQTENSPLPIPAVNIYGSKRKKLADNWQNIRPPLEEAYYSSRAPLTNQCAHCESRSDEILHCPDCGPCAYFCQDCCDKIHKFAPLHIPLKWQGELYIPAVTWKYLWVPGHEDCDSNISPTNIIDEKGREHHINLLLCSCNTKFQSLMLLGFWPGSPQNPNTAFDLRFMEQARAFLLEGAMALKKFCSSVQLYNKCLPSYCTHVDIYRVLSMDCAAQHRSFHYNVNHLTNIVPDYPDGTQCPVCKMTKGKLPQIVSMDGNFRLVRKKSSGVSYTSPHHGSKFFLEDDYVQQYLSQPSSADDMEDCSDFQAGSEQNRTFKSKGLDITGVFGSICIHNYPLHFIDLSAGEKLGYSVAIINKLKETGRDGMKFMYDVACKIKPQLQKSGIDLATINLAVPVFHGYAHDAPCQVIYNPRLLAGFRLADGENIERFWSHLGEYSYITREMTASNRRDLLTDAMLHLGDKSLDNMVATMVNRLETAFKEYGNAVASLDKLCQSTVNGQRIDESTVQEWADNFAATYGKKERKPKGNAETWKEKYAKVLKAYYSIRQKVVSPALLPEEIQNKNEFERLEGIVSKMERTHKITYRWRVGSDLLKQQLAQACAKMAMDLRLRLHRESIERRHLITLRKDARGYEAASKISKQLNRTNTKIQVLLKQHNEVSETQKLSFDEVRDPGAAIFKTFSPYGNIPYSVVKEAVWAHHLKLRTKEEIDAVQTEMLGLLEWYREVHAVLLNPVLEGTMHVGERAHLLQFLLENERKQSNIVQMIGKKYAVSLQHDTQFIDNVKYQSSQFEYSTPSDEHISDEDDVNVCNFEDDDTEDTI